MKYQTGDYVAVHPAPIWRERANFIFMAHLGAKDGRNEWEQLWGQRIGVQRFMLCCIPFFLNDVALGDELETDNDFVLRKVIQRGGQVTFRVWFGNGDAAVKRELVKEIEAMNALMEWSSENLLALSAIQPDAKKLADYLHARELQDLLQYETGAT